MEEKDTIEEQELNPKEDTAGEPEQSSLAGVETRRETIIKKIL